MSISCAIIMDPIQSIHYKKDTSLAFLWEAAARQWDLFYLEQKDLFLQDGVAYGNARSLQVFKDPAHWYQFEGEAEAKALHDFDVILMRKDPPFDVEYIYTTYLLEIAEAKGALVINKPASLRDANEKLFTAWFPECCPPTLVTREKNLVKQFLAKHKDIVCKPLGGMGGLSIYRVTEEDPNLNVIIESLSAFGTTYFMAQRYIPEIKTGDKRVLMIAGKPFPYALLRVPAPGETRGNLAAGGTGVGVELSEQDRKICQEVGPILKAKGLIFVGLDIIGDHLTEINVTSPTCVREIDAAFNTNISAVLLDEIEKMLAP